MKQPRHGGCAAKKNAALEKKQEPELRRGKYLTNSHARVCIFFAESFEFGFKSELHYSALPPRFPMVLLRSLHIPKPPGSGREKARNTAGYGLRLYLYAYLAQEHK